MSGFRAVEIAHLTGNVTAQRVAAGISDDLRDAVLGNEHRDPQLWCELYQTTGPRKLSPAVAKVAANGPLNDDQIEHVLGCEKRSSVLSVVFEGRCPTPATLARPQLRKLLGEERYAKKIAESYGPVLDFDVLASIPAAELNGRLRVWRLLSRTLTDDEVLEELRSFTTWGNGYVQAPLGWAIHQRPHLVAEIAACDSIDVRVQVAAGPHMGKLTVDQQRTLLYLDTPLAEVGKTWLNERVFLWLAGTSNPTTDLALVDDLAKRLEAQTEKFDASDNARRRKEYNNWSISSLSDPVDENHIDRLVRWAAPKNGKSKPHGVAELIRNPSLDEASAERLADGVLADLVARPLWRTREARLVLVEFLERFPSLAPHYQLVEIWDEQHAHAVSSTSVDDVRDRTAAAVDPTAGSRTVAWGLDYRGVRWLDDRIGENAQTWSKVFELVDTLEQATLEELVVTCQAMSM